VSFVSYSAVVFTAMWYSARSPGAAAAGESVISSFPVADLGNARTSLRLTMHEVGREAGTVDDNQDS